MRLIREKSPQPAAGARNKALPFKPPLFDLHIVLVRLRYDVTFQPFAAGKPSGDFEVFAHWVGIYILDGDTLELGPFIGAPSEHTRIKVGVGVCGTAVARNEDLNVPDVTAADNYLACSVETQSELVVLIRDRDGAVLGQIDIDSHTRHAFTPPLESAVQQIAHDLGDFWPKSGARKGRAR